MRKIKASSIYLKNQTRKNLAKAALCILATGGVLAVMLYGLLFPLPFGLSTSNLLVVLPELIVITVFLVGFYYYQRKYQVFNGGWQGEKQVANLLTQNLSDDYYLLNDLYLQGGGGDIDHIVLAPAGVFVLETKNWSGNITVNGDEWHRDRNHAAGSSPSNQVKRNTQKIRNILDHSPNLRNLGIWVEGIVVIASKHAQLHLNNPTVPVLTLPEVPNYIKNRGAQRRLSKEQLELIGKEIAKQKA
jgi:hypothetical protein